MPSKNNIISMTVLLVSLVSLIFIVLLFVREKSDDRDADYQNEKILAGELTDNNLYHAAIEEYATILEDKSLDATAKANINYLIGKIYFENLFDYEKAAAHYVRARSMNPEATYYNEAGRNLITCFERMGRLLDAKRELDKAVNVDSIKTLHAGEKAVANIDGRPIYQSDLENEIQQLPLEAQKQFVGKEGMLAFLNNYIASELMYQAALREGFDTDTEIIAKKILVERQLLIEKYATEKVFPEVAIADSDMRNFYLANKSNRYGDKSYDEVRSQVVVDYRQEKSQQAFGSYISKLSAISKVKIFEENIR